MNIIEGMTFDEERALYGSCGIVLNGCSFRGPADGESALKESSDIEVNGCFFDLRYPFWHDSRVIIRDSEMTETCRAALWYSENIIVKNTKMHGIKALRECRSVHLEGCDILSPEFGWSVTGMTMKDCTAQSEYFLMRSEKITFENVEMKGKYSFQYIEDGTFENCRFDTKDAFWHCKNVTVRNSIVKGEYLGWYSENLIFENCSIIGTQPLCYCKGLKLINCEMVGTDLSFEKSNVDAVLTSPIDSIKNPASGRIVVPAVGKIIMDDPNAKCGIVLKNDNYEMR